MADVNCIGGVLVFEELLTRQTCWEFFQNTTLPIVCYGTGNGADKILDEFARIGVVPAAFTASDGFVRDRSFRGYRVRRFADCEKEFGEFCVAVCFGSQRSEVLQTVSQIAMRHKTLVPTAAVCGDEIFNRAFFSAYRQDFETAFSLLADKTSQSVFLDYLQFSLTGELPYLFRCASPKAEAFQTILRLGAQEDYLDLGAYRGDTIREFLTYCGGTYSSITAAEPDKNSFEKLRAYTADLPNVRLYNLAVWNQRQTLSFSKAAGRGSAARQNAQYTVTADSVDGLLHGDSVTYLKADVEGAEAEMLDGAAHTLQVYKPKLNIAAYHRCHDVPVLIQKIHACNPAYRIHLRHHPYIPCWDLNLYCV